MKKSDWPDVLLLAYCGSLLFFAVVFAVIGYLAYNSTLDWHVITYAAVLFGVAQALTTLVVPLAVGRTSLKAAAFIVVGLALIVTIATLVQRVMHASALDF